MERKSSSSSSSRSSRKHSIGCMTAIFHHLLSKRDGRSKFLTSGSTKKLKSQRAAAPAQSPIEAHEDEEVRLIKAPNFIPRQAEMRQEKSVGVTPSHAVVARLMGLELNHNKVALTPVPEVEYNARMKLLGAVEKCDEDLKALQRIIQVVKPAGGNKSFDAALPLPLLSTTLGVGRTTIQPKKKKQLLHTKKAGGEDIREACFFDRFTRRLIDDAKSNVNAASVFGRSKAMVHNVDQVCNDISWGERREMERIGLALQDHICRDLIEEIIREIGYYSTFVLPFQACKRGLSF